MICDRSGLFSYYWHFFDLHTLWYTDTCCSFNRSEYLVIITTTKTIFCLLLYTSRDTKVNLLVRFGTSIKHGLLTQTKEKLIPELTTGTSNNLNFTCFTVFCVHIWHIFCNFCYIFKLLLAQKKLKCGQRLLKRILLLNI